MWGNMTMERSLFTNSVSCLTVNILIWQWPRSRFFVHFPNIQEFDNTKTEVLFLSTSIQNPDTDQSDTIHPMNDGHQSAAGDGDGSGSSSTVPLAIEASPRTASSSSSSVTSTAAVTSDRVDGAAAAASAPGPVSSARHPSKPPATLGVNPRISGQQQQQLPVPVHHVIGVGPPPPRRMMPPFGVYPPPPHCPGMHHPHPFPMPPHVIHHNPHSMPMPLPPGTQPQHPNTMLARPPQQRSNMTMIPPPIVVSSAAAAAAKKQQPLTNKAAAVAAAATSTTTLVLSGKSKGMESPPSLSTRPPRWTENEVSLPTESVLQVAKRIKVHPYQNSFCTYKPLLIYLLLFFSSFRAFIIY